MYLAKLQLKRLKSKRLSHVYDVTVHRHDDPLGSKWESQETAFWWHVQPLEWTQTLFAAAQTSTKCHQMKTVSCLIKVTAAAEPMKMVWWPLVVHLRRDSGTVWGAWKAAFHTNICTYKQVPWEITWQSPNTLNQVKNKQNRTNTKQKTDTSCQEQ